MSIKQFDLWIANLNPQKGTEPGKKRPVVVLQTDLLNQTGHPSTIVCPLTTNVQKDIDLLRVHISEGTYLPKPSDILVDQIRAIDNRRLEQRIGRLPRSLDQKLKENIRIILDL